MNPGSSEFKQALADLKSDLDAQMFHSCFVVSNSLKTSPNALRYTRFAKLSHALEAAIRSDTHETRENRHGDTGGAAHRDEMPVHLGVENHLGDDEIGTRVYLGLEVVNLRFVVSVAAHVYNSLTAVSVLGVDTQSLIVAELVNRAMHLGHAVGVALGVASHRHAELIAVLRADVTDQIQSTGEAALRSCPFLLAERGVSAQGQHIGHTGLSALFKSHLNLIHLHVGAGQVHVWVEVELINGLLAQLDSQVAGAATSSPGEISEQRVKRLQFGNYIVQSGQPRLGLRREELYVRY